MKQANNTVEAFLALVRAGLWESDVRVLPFGDLDYAGMYRIAISQSVTGLLYAGLKHVCDADISKEYLPVFSDFIEQLEIRNISQDYFIDVMIDKMRGAGISALLIKGQGIARCYEQPAWRLCGDIDFLLDGANYTKALNLMSSMAQSVKEENPYTRHVAMTISPWEVEIHGSLRSDLGRRVDRVLDRIMDDTFVKGKVRTWKNGLTDVSLLAPDNDVIYVFTHILHHFFRGGIGLRQVCDWCRLLWTYRESIDRDCLKARIAEMGLMSEWKSFAVLAVEVLGMSADSMPLYSGSRRWRRKADRVLQFILESGSFGINRDVSYYEKYPYLVFKAISLWRKSMDAIRHASVFPVLSTIVWLKMITTGVNVAVKGD